MCISLLSPRHCVAVAYNLQPDKWKFEAVAEGISELTREIGNKRYMFTSRSSQFLFFFFALITVQKLHRCHSSGNVSEPLNP
jgi:hypothetical protein